MLGAMAAVPAVTMDMYLPSMPQIAEDFATTQSMVQVTISAILIGGAVGQLINGPISDRFGRRLPFFVGMGLHVLMSIACMVVPSIYGLIAVRLLQGVGNASATVAAMAVLRDRYSGAAFSAGLSRIMMVISVAPIIAPSVGGFIAVHWGWHGVFGVLAAIGLLIMLGVWRFLPETLPSERRSHGGFARMLRSYGPLLRDWNFLRRALVPGLTTVVLMSYISSASFVYQDTFGLSPSTFALVFALNGLGIILASQLNTRIVFHLGTRRILVAAIGFEILVASTLLVTSVLGAGGLWVFAVCTALLVAVNALATPNAAATALLDQGHRAGTAAAFVGATQAGFGGLFSPLVGVLGGGPTAVSVVALTALAIALVLVLTGPAAQERPQIPAVE